jgi:Flp pilus assembly pilin Flp
MTSLVQRLRARRAGGERGQTMAEYAVVLAVITAAIVAAISTLDTSIVDAIGNIGSRI